MSPNDLNNYHYFFNNINDLIIILNPDGMILEINGTACKKLGYSEEDLSGKYLTQIVSKDGCEKIKNYIIKTGSEGQSLATIQFLKKDYSLFITETIFKNGLWNSKPVIIMVCRDITELKLSEEKFFKVFNLSHVIMIISTTDNGLFINVNKQFLKTFGYSKDEVIGKTSKDLELFFDYDQRQYMVDYLERNGYVENYEIILQTKNGKLLNCLYSIEKVSIFNQEYLLTSITNISELKKAEIIIKHLYNQQKLLADISQLLNSSPHLHIILDEVLSLLGNHTDVSRVYIFEDSDDGCFTNNTYEWCNENIVPQIKELQEIPYEIIPSWKNMLIENGYIFSENIKELPDDIYQILAPQEIKSILVYPLYVQKSFYGFIGFDECVMNKMWTNDELDLLRTVSNIISSAFERTQTLKQLENSELRLKLAIESANEGLWDWNIKTGKVYFNEIWCSMLGYTQYEIEPSVSSWEKLLHPDDLEHVNNLLNEHLNGNSEYYETIHRLKTKDGNWKWILDHGKVVTRDSNNYPLRAIGTHIDITKQKLVEEELKNLIITKDKLFSIIAHDLRGPIGNFLPVLDFLIKHNDLNDSLKSQILEELKKNSRNTFNLLENLLSWSKSQTDQIKLNPSHLNLYELVNDNILLYKTSFVQKSIEIKNLIDKDSFVYADQDSINIVIRNLINNAIKFTNENGTICLSSYNNETHTYVEISDNGIGIKKEILDTLFNNNSFFSSAGTNKEKGTGLGLVLCKDFIDKNGGTIFAESTPGKGSKFVFSLPRV